MAVGMFDSFITRCGFSAEAREIWSDLATLQAWLDVELALAKAEAALGMIPRECADTIAANADARRFDLDRLSADIEFAGHPFVPVLRQFEALCGEPAAGFIHLGATTQNIFDTALALQMRANHELTIGHLRTALDALRSLAGVHAGTVQAGRTHGQHALPMTFGFKVAGWVDQLERDVARLEHRFAGSFVVSMGGAIGSFAAFAGRGRDVQDLMAKHLRLASASLPMRSSFDRVCDYVTTLGLLSGTMQKIAGDVVFMQRTEIGEVEERFYLGKVGSSTMAQKRNPSTAQAVVTLARLLRSRVPLALESMVQCDEGDASASHVTDTTVPEVAIFAASIAETFARLVGGLSVNPEAMARNVNMTRGLISSEAIMMDLTRRIGRHTAHHLLYECAQESVSRGIGLLTVLRERPELAGYAEGDLQTLVDPRSYTGLSAEIATACASPAASKAEAP